jgi:hypothetical protein
MDSLLERMATLEHILQHVQDERKRLEQRERLAGRRLRFWQSVAAALIIAALLLSPSQRVTAQGNNSLVAQVAALQTAVANLQTQVSSLQTALNNEVTNRQNGDAATLASARSYTDQQAASTLAAAKSYIDDAVSFEALNRVESDTILFNEVTPLADIFVSPNRFDRPYFSRQGDDITIDGANLHIVNGLGATNGLPTDPTSIDPAHTVVNGLGNLIVGYNELRAGLPGLGSDDRSGSHNLVVGSLQNFSSFGGLVAGELNSISGAYASVSGGYANRASGIQASVSGGDGNIASGGAASVSGGDGNTASGNFASVSGGFGTDAPLEWGWAAGAFHSP